MGSSLLEGGCLLKGGAYCWGVLTGGRLLNGEGAY